MEIEWGIQTQWGGIIRCRDRKHAEGLLKSTSTVLGPPRFRKVVIRQVTPWGEA